MSSRASASSRAASGEPSRDRGHRAVLGVEVDALAPARGAAAVEHRAGERAGREHQRREEPTPRHPGLLARRARLAVRGGERRRSSAGSASGRRRRGRPWGPAASWPPRSRGRSSRGRRRRCPRASPPRAARDRADRVPGAAHRPRSRSVATPSTKRAARAESAIVVARTEPSASMIATCTTCEEISVRSASAWAASMGRSILRRLPHSGADPRRKFFADRGTHLAAMIAYFALLSFVPLLFLSLSVLGAADQANRARSSSASCSGRSRARRSTRSCTRCARSRRTRRRSGSSAAPSCSGRRCRSSACSRARSTSSTAARTGGFLRGKALAIADDGRLARGAVRVARRRVGRRRAAAAPRGHRATTRSSRRVVTVASRSSASSSSSRPRTTC